MNLHQSVLLIIDAMRDDAKELRATSEHRWVAAKLEAYAAELEASFIEDEQIRTHHAAPRSK